MSNLKKRQFLSKCKILNREFPILHHSTDTSSPSLHHTGVVTVDILKRHICGALGMLRIWQPQLKAHANYCCMNNNMHKAFIGKRQMTSNSWRNAQHIHQEKATNLLPNHSGGSCYCLYNNCQNNFKKRCALNRHFEPSYSYYSSS